MVTMQPSDVANDTRGWIMCVVSGIACVAGASIICVDSLLRLLPKQKHFRIQDSNAFLAGSLSLSFGVMIFSALYNMLPASKRYLLKAGWEEDKAGFLMMGCFVGGFIGIQVISRLLHRLMPSHVVDCDHSHDDQVLDAHSDHGDSSRRQSRPPRRASPAPAKIVTLVEENSAATESTPLLPSELTSNGGLDPISKNPPVNGDLARPPAHAHAHHSTNGGVPHAHHHSHPSRPHTLAASVTRRPSMLQVRDRVLSFVRDTKANCDELGPCYGYTDPCGQECFKHRSSRSALTRVPSAVMRTSTWFSSANPFSEVAEDGQDGEFRNPGIRTGCRAQSRDTLRAPSEHRDHDGHAHVHHHHHDGDHSHDIDSHDSDGHSGSPDEDLEAQHHHHVPTNAFMSIGLQTVIAIALHKFPEGFITYATNIASPSLGFNVFMALFVHNIAEGFSMALPLYMALGSKVKAIAWSSVLGGLSQPAGAAIAWLWFRVARRSHFEIDNVAYAALFAVTAGIMASVALQLFVESLSLNHNKNLSIAFAFLGMVLLGTSSALVNDE